MINITINGRQSMVQAGLTVLQAAKQMGIRIPTLCHHPALTDIGACRICLVEVAEQKTLQPACTFPVKDGLVVWTDTPKVRTARRFVLDLLLSDHPLDCLTCERAGACELQDLAYEYGVKETSFPGERHAYMVDDTNPFIQRDYNKCILCRRCVRACDEINGIEAIGVIWRGFRAKIGTAMDSSLQNSSCEFCGMCVATCPTGALIPKDSLGKGRAWQRREVPTICSYCGVGCRLNLQTVDGQIVEVTSNWEGPANRGATCVKGRFGHDYVRHPDRLRTPLVRRNGQLEPVSWDEALALVASRLQEIKSTHGADALAVLASAKCTNEENYLLQKFARAVLGTQNVDHCARLCHSASVTGLVISFGSGAMTNSIADVIDQAQGYFVIGSNTTEQHPVIGMGLRRAVKRRGAQIIVADPRRIPLVDFAAIHLCHRPGSDIALLNSLMNVLIAENLYEARFVAERTEGFEDLKAKVVHYTPEMAAEITGVPPEQVRQAARLMARLKPMALLYAMGITQHTTGHQNVMSCANLQMLLGNMGVPGGGVNPLRGQSNVQGACDMGALPNVYPGYQNVAVDEVRNKFEAAWGVSLGKRPGLTVVEMLNAAEAGKVKGLYIMGENPMLSDPDVGHVRRCLEHLDFLVVQDIFLTETAALAHVVLPGSSFAEKAGTFTNTERRVQMLTPAVPLPGEAREDWRIICDLARRMQLRHPDAPYGGFDYASPAQVMEEIAALTPSYGGIRHERLGHRGLQWPCPDVDHPGTPILHRDKFTRGLGRFMPVDWLPPAEQPDEEYPLVLTTGRVLYHYHTGSLSRRSKGLAEFYPEGKVEIHPEDACRLGIADGSLAQVSSRRGRVTVKAEVTERTQPGVVFMTFHFAESAANVLTSAALDPVAKIPEYKVCAVRVEPLECGAVKKA